MSASDIQTETVKMVARAIHENALDQTKGAQLHCDESPSSLKSVMFDGDFDLEELAKAAIGATLAVPKWREQRQKRVALLQAIHAAIVGLEGGDPRSEVVSNLEDALQEDGGE